MTTVSLPKGNVPVGWATVGDQRVPVTIDMEWMRALSDMVRRVGGPAGEDTSTIAANAATALALASSVGFFQRPQPAPIVGIDSGRLLMTRVFNRAPVPSERPADDAASILATRVFRK